MAKKVLHGEFSPNDLAAVLNLHFNRGNLEARRIGSEEQIVVQIRSKSTALSGGQTAIGVTLEAFEDGVIITVGRQQWVGIAASLGFSAMAALRNPLNLLGRIDDIAQDLEYLGLEEEIWRVLETNAQSKGSKFALSKRLKRMACEYCATANPIDAPNCVSCGAPLGDVQPRTCEQCGFVLTTAERNCPNCAAKVA